jgi:hypothetical protein
MMICLFKKKKKGKNRSNRTEPAHIVQIKKKTYRKEQDTL